MTFAFPHLLWLVLLPLAFLVWELTRQRTSAAGDHEKILRAEAGPSSLRLSTPASPLSSASSRRARPWLWLGLACCLVAPARPQWGRVDEPVFDQSREILIAIDLSRSMLTPDIKPSRLERAKLLTQALLEKLTGERVGLVVFSGTAFLQSPLSADYEILREFLPALDPNFLPEGGTNYRALIDTSLAAFGATASADRFLIILSDGEATEDTWRDRIPELKTKGIRVLALGVGTAGGAMIPDGSGGFVKDERGAVVLSKLEPATLRQLASSTGGVYADASTWIDLAGLINSTVEAGRKGQFMEKNSVRLVERFQWPLALGLWLLLVSFYYEFPVRPKPREIKLAGIPSARKDNSTPPPPPAPSPNAGPTVTVAVLAVALLALTLYPSAFAETPAAPQPPPLSRIVTRLADADQRTGRDWAEFAQETVNWGSRLQSSQPQQPVPEGPVHDALAAVDLGEKIDAKTADWPRLRRELEALLQKPPEQKQDQQKQDQQQQQKQNQPQDQNQQNQQQKQDASKQQDQQNQPPDSRKKDESRPDQNKSDSEKQQEQQREKQSAFGDMKDRPPPPPEETQKVGGTPEQKGEPPPTDPSLAIPLQKLDQLKNQDSPAELFKLMEGEQDKTPRKKTKDW